MDCIMFVEWYDEVEHYSYHPSDRETIRHDNDDGVPEPCIHASLVRNLDLARR